MRTVVQLAITIAATMASMASAQTWVSTATKGIGPSLKGAHELGALSSSTPMHLVVGLKVQNAASIQPTLRRMLTPGDPLYGTSYTVAQFAAQFAPTAARVQAVEDYLSSYGFKNLTVSDNRLLIEADATAGQAMAAFNTALASFTLNGKTIFANTMDAQVPAALSSTVLAVLGLNNISALHPDIFKYTDPCTAPACPTPDPSNEEYGAQQYQIAYDAAEPGATPTSTALKQKVATGSLTKIGIITEGDLGAVSPKAPNGPGLPSASSTGVIHDLYLYEQLYKLPGVNVYMEYAGIASPDTSGADEWDLDTQTSTGIAQQVKDLYLYIATSLTDSDIGLAVNKAVTDNKVKAFNMSFGECEFFPYLDGAMLLDDELFGEAALQGMTPFASADDNGSACPVLPTNGVPLSGPPSVSYPASSPYVISVGGTNLLTNANFTYDYEIAWEGGGGGVSGFETAPFWQSYTGSGTLPIVPSAEAGQRGVPDVAMCAGGTGLAICSANIFVGGATELVGGTSLSSPLSVGSWARIETSHANKLGFAGPLIYQLANGGPTPSSPYFNDVTLGANGYGVALPGYDYTTGLGSWDIYVVNKQIPSTYPH
ncbi:MAG: S8/S53 family peptidase [Acidobacteriaceae bacterium]|nr:S8/S53 family peptidase [Acidobacteriaceae bacterium]